MGVKPEWNQDSDSDDQKGRQFSGEINRGDTAELTADGRWWLKKVASFFLRKIGVAPSVAAPGDTNPSDATRPILGQYERRELSDEDVPRRVTIVDGRLGHLASMNYSDG